MDILSSDRERLTLANAEGRCIPKPTSRYSAGAMLEHRRRDCRHATLCRQPFADVVRGARLGAAGRISWR